MGLAVEDILVPLPSRIGTAHIADHGSFDISGDGIIQQGWGELTLAGADSVFFEYDSDTDCIPYTVTDDAGETIRAGELCG